MAALIVPSLEVVAGVLQQYATEAAALFTEQGRPVDSVVGVAPGVAPAWDSSCSQLYTRFVTTQPGGGTDPTSACGVPFWVVTCAIAVTRCVGTPDVSGGRIKLPSAERVTADGVVMLQDLAALEQVVKCSPWTRSLVQGASLPEAGGLAGVEWAFTLRVNNCPCPEGS